MNDSSEILGKLQAAFAETFRVEAPTPDTDLVDNGILDSFQLVELLARIDTEFGCALDLEDIDLDDLRTLDRLAQLICRQRRQMNSHAGSLA